MSVIIILLGALDLSGIEVSLLGTYVSPLKPWTDGLEVIGEGFDGEFGDKWIAVLRGNAASDGNG